MTTHRHLTLLFASCALWLSMTAAHAGNGNYYFPLPDSMSLHGDRLHYEIANQVEDVLHNRTNLFTNSVPGSSGFAVNLQSPASGLNAGDSGTTVRGWGTLSWGTMEDDGTLTEFDGDMSSAFFGVDAQLTDRWLLGLAAGVNYMNTNSDINLGTSDVTTYTVSPYAAFIINKNYSIDASAGYGWGDIDMTHAGFLIGGPPINVTGDTDSERWFGAVNLNANYWWQNKWNLGVRLGYLYSRERQDSFTESDSIYHPSRTFKLGQVQFDATLAYWAGAVMPYVGVGYEQDTTRTGVELMGIPDPDTDRNGFVLRAGMRLFVTERAFGRMELKTLEGRHNYDSTSFAGTFGVRF